MSQFDLFSCYDKLPLISRAQCGSGNAQKSFSFLRLFRGADSLVNNLR